MNNYQCVASWVALAGTIIKTQAGWTIVVSRTLRASLDTVVSFKIYNHDLNDTNIIKHSLLSVQ